MEIPGTTPSPFTAPVLASIGAALATMRAMGAVETARRTGDWIDCSFVDGAGLPLSGVAFRLTLPDGTTFEGALCGDGAIRRDVPEAGRYEVQLIEVFDAVWSSTRVRAGEAVGMSATTTGFDDGTPVVFTIYHRCARTADAVADVLQSSVRAGCAEAQWLRAPASSVALPDEPPAHDTLDFYFEVAVGKQVARSGRLEVIDDLSIHLTRPDGSAAAGGTYVAQLPGGGLRTGRLDADGRALERDVTPGQARVVLVG
jgi:hypothetical protein